MDKGGAKLQHIAREEEEASAGGVEMTEASKGGNESGKASYDLNLPVPDETAAPCIVKVGALSVTLFLEYLFQIFHC